MREVACGNPGSRRGRRVRTHTNPLKRFPNLEPPDWSEVFEDPSRPFFLEFGSSKGVFLLGHARNHPSANILGTEVRKPLVDRLEKIIRETPIRNAAVVYGNIAGRIAEFTPGGRIAGVYILFPDPWPKKRHRKRRIVQPELLEELESLMDPGAGIELMTDHAGMAEWIEEVFAESEAFRGASPLPLPARSHWQIHCDTTARPYRRFRYERV